MLPLIILAAGILLAASLGAGVVWSVLSGLLAPEVAATGSSLVLLASSVALASLLLRLRRRHRARAERTVRRSQSVRDREPLRYDLEPTPSPDDAAADTLVHPLPAGRDAGGPIPLDPADAERLDRALVADALTLWLEPVVAMPLNETVAWLAHPGDGEAAVTGPADLREGSRSSLELGLAALVIARAARLDGPVLSPIGAAVLGDRDAALELRRMVDADPAGATHMTVVARPEALDVLAAGRLDDLLDEGVGLAVDGVDLATLDRSAAAALAARGAGMALFAARELDPATHSRALRWLMEAGIEPVALGVVDEEEMLRLADANVTRFAGPAFARPRRARSDRPGTARAQSPRGASGASADRLPTGTTDDADGHGTKERTAT